MSNVNGRNEDPMLSPTPWALALGLPGDEVERVVIDVRAGALPVVMVEARPGSEAAAAVCALVGRLDPSVVVRPMSEPERASVGEILEDLQADAMAMRMRGDNGRADFAEHYAGRLAGALA